MQSSARFGALVALAGLAAGFFASAQLQDDADGALRLVNGIDTYGLLQVKYGQQWGYVCDDLWEDYPQNAAVACRQLGLPYGEATYTSAGPAISSYLLLGVVLADIERELFVLDQVTCDGTEERLDLCQANPPFYTDCGPREAVTLICADPEPAPPPPVEGSLRLLAGFTQNSGRLDMYRGGTWGSVCADGWGTVGGFSTNAQVACHQLGRPYSGARLTPGLRGNTALQADDVACLGNETRLADCPQAKWGNVTCETPGRVGLVCEEVRPPSPPPMPSPPLAPPPMPEMPDYPSGTNTAPPEVPSWSSPSPPPQNGGDPNYGGSYLSPPSGGGYGSPPPAGYYYYASYPPPPTGTYGTVVHEDGGADNV